MGKPTGFLEYKRVEAKERPVQERIEDYNEYLLPYDEEGLKIQSARCMDCGVPFCQAGLIVDKQTVGCPLSNLIPEINDLVYHGRTEAAYERLSKTNPFPEITGRVCPALCEGSCTLGEHEPAVTIKDIERFVADKMILSSDTKPRFPKIHTGKRVAVIGSGPAGLACADLLNQLGNDVTVFERADRPGGLLMYGIPNMKLDKSLVLKRAELMKAEGIKFVLNAHIGSGYSFHELIQAFDAIVLCLGATQERILSVPGNYLTGVVTAMSYLTGATKELLAGRSLKSPLLDAGGKNVIVVGGGDTGADCVATAIRQKARGVSQLEIMPPFPHYRKSDNPWPLWPAVKRHSYEQEEALAFFGRDPKEYETTVKEILGTSDGRVTGVKTVKVSWSGENGKNTAQEIAGSEQIRPADLVITALGFTGPEKVLLEQLNLEIDNYGTPETENINYKSNLPMVFVAGDMRRGPSLVVWALMEGRQAAKQCSDYLKNA
ncbi:MAG: glutamate synthase subunit beta [Syntrophomonadaceae bacterium]|jgi:glutamate synthase (NADPH/NADH) small chain|nr:glutamate synthase subunit beta [Syntrophomonadaceae bacterium]